MATKIPNGRKIDQMAIKYSNIFYCKTLQNLPKIGIVLFENIPSGNPGFKTSWTKLDEHDVS
jgi:hypothetical protein